MIIYFLLHRDLMIFFSLFVSLDKSKNGFGIKNDKVSRKRVFGQFVASSSAEDPLPVRSAALQC